ncbi:heme-degrading domain-containing protein [Agrobacterium sp. rho-8.1]|nr:heme-degrading domain-containing protein [Agrobacterium sp. rho-8.1]
MAAQIPTLDMLKIEEDMLQLERFDYDFAWVLGSHIRKKAVLRNLPVAVEVRHGADVVFASLLPGATVDNFGWTSRKCAVVHRFHRSSLRVRLQAEAGGYDFNAKFGLPSANFVASGGGFPLTLRGGTLIGSVAVSGLPDVEDHALITASLRELL